MRWLRPVLQGGAWRGCRTGESLTLARRSLVAVALTSLLIGGVVLSAGQSSAEPYEVKPGDSLSLIAEQHGIAQGIILALNPDLVSPDQLFSGQLIDLPDNAVYLPSLARITHTVAPGETLSGIAALYDVSIADLLILNPQLRLDVLWIGTELVIRDDFAGAVTQSPAPTIETPQAESEPVVAPTNGPSIGGLTVAVYRVEPGDTLTGIAQRFGTTVETLIVFNPSVRPDRLFIDAILWVPKQPGSLEPIATRPSADAPLELPTIPYLVIEGDSANLIAQRNDLTLEQLQRLNDDLDLSRIFIGQILLIPGRPDQVLASADAASSVIGGPGLRPEPSESVDVREFTLYIVRPGDSGYALAATFELELPELASLNPGINFGLLRIGQTLVVPKIDLPPPAPGTAPAGPPPANVYTVVPGDNLSAIALRFETTTNTIVDLNPGLDPDLLRVDQELRLPGTMPLPVVAHTITLDFSGGLESVAAAVAVLPHTLLANNPSLGDWVSAGTMLHVPIREGVLVTVQPGDTLLGIARQFGSSVERLAGDPMTGVIGPNQLVVGQQLLILITLPEFAWPFFDGIVTDGFGFCRTADCSVVHRGVDLSRGLGSSVRAIADGTVTFVGGSYCCGLGFYVKIAHANGFESLYGHLNGAPPVLLGQTIARGDIIGYVGTTGFSTGPHLHLELQHNDWYLNPLNYLP